MSQRFVFIGDINVNAPTGLAGAQAPLVFQNSANVIANLEGPIIDEGHKPAAKARRRFPLENSLSAIDVLRAYHVTAVNLANNHFFDFHNALEGTRRALQPFKIRMFGAGDTLETASAPLVFESDHERTYIFGFGWREIGCQIATTNHPGVNPLLPGHILRSVERIKRTDLSSRVVVLVHWGYELEPYPQPAHRELASQLLRQGVDAVIGCHSHIVQGAEEINGKPVIYGLGNWFFPDRQINAFSLRYPAVSKHRCAVELNYQRAAEEKALFHWFVFDPGTKSLAYQRTEDINGPIISGLTPFKGLPTEEYVTWFRHHRKRRKGLPIFRDYQHPLRNYWKSQLVLGRQKMIELLLQAGLKR